MRTPTEPTWRTKTISGASINSVFVFSFLTLSPCSSNLLSQLTAVERLALRHLEHVEGGWRDEQLRLADAELAAQKAALEEAKRAEDEQLQQELEERRRRLAEEQEEESDDDDSDDGSDDDDTDEEEEEEDTDDEDDEEDDDDGEGDDENSEDEDQDEEVADDVVASPRTRSRGDVKINLWRLDKNEKRSK